mmetsp:Transcript_2030/g.13064  ORF Transcript_2030/g.13064 Transcript_2030/m.13064 type:complete len:241 (+) Transcript_2030:822-1544(+)
MCIFRHFCRCLEGNFVHGFSLVRLSIILSFIFEKHRCSSYCYLQSHYNNLPRRSSTRRDHPYHYQVWRACQTFRCSHLKLVRFSTAQVKFIFNVQSLQIQGRESAEIQHITLYSTDDFLLYLTIGPFPRRTRSCVVAAVARFSFDSSMKAITSPAMTTPRLALHTRRSAIGATLICDGASGSTEEKRNAASVRIYGTVESMSTPEGSTNDPLQADDDIYSCFRASHCNIYRGSAVLCCVY